MGNRKSLGSIIAKYAVFELLYTLFMMVVFFIVFAVLINRGFLYPAKFAEINAVNIENDFKKDDFSTDEIPYFYDYRYTVNEKVLENTIDSRYSSEVERAVKNGSAVENRFIGNKVFIVFRKENSNLVLSYNLSAIPASEKVYKYMKNFELYYFILFLIIWVAGFVLLINRCIRIVKQEINKIAVANSYIQKFQLDYPREQTKYAEIYNVLSSLDIMAEDLKKSLKEQWDMQQEQREIIESVTHDIRTPITLIKGNLELLKEDSENRCYYIDDIEKGVARLEAYIKKLRDYTEGAESAGTEVNEESLMYWISNMESLLSSKGRRLDVKSRDISSVKLVRESVDTALQNIAVNAVENSDPGTAVEIDFKDCDDCYIISVRDEGRGFDSEIIKRAQEKYVTSKSSKDGTHGLGLYIVGSIAQKNNGRLEISNYCNKGRSGAEVRLIFSKN